ncbi:MAG TPA: ABC transporter permease [Alphaproteobacteria bacterium]
MIKAASILAAGTSQAWLRAISFVLLLVIWEVAAAAAQSRVLPDPWQVATAFWDHLVNGSLLGDLGITLWRVISAFVLAMVIGTAVGIVMGLRRRVDALLDGWLILFLNIPALVTIILCYVWFGLTEAAAILAVSLNKIPNVVVTIREGSRAIDRDLLEVARIFRVDRRRTFLRFFLPQLYPYLMIAGRSGIALIWKIVLVVELLGRSNGIGFQLSIFFQQFNIAALLAYTMAFIVVMLLVEIGVVEPLERRMTRWRK